MKTETLLLLGGLAYLFLKSRSAPVASPGPSSTSSSAGSGGAGGTVVYTPPGPGTIAWISCDSPQADPVMCSNMGYGGYNEFYG